MALQLSTSVRPHRHSHAAMAVAVAQPINSSSSSSLVSSQTSRLLSKNLRVSVKSSSSKSKYGVVRVRCSSSSSSTETTVSSESESAVVVGKVTEVNKDTFWPIVKAAGDKTVVLDMYTQWILAVDVPRNITAALGSMSTEHAPFSNLVACACLYPKVHTPPFLSGNGANHMCGPCKIMAPKFQELSEKYLDVVFLKLDCNQENKPLAKELGIRVVPTFKILRDSKIVKEVTGAKFDDLVLAIETVRSS